MMVKQKLKRTRFTDIYFIIFNLEKPDIPFPVFYRLEWNDSGGMTLEKGNDWHVQGDSQDATLRNANNVYTCSVNYFIFGAH